MSVIENTQLETSVKDKNLVTVQAASSHKVTYLSPLDFRQKDLHSLGILISQVGKAMQKMHERKNIGKLILSPMKEPTQDPVPVPTAPAESAADVSAVHFNYSPAQNFYV